MNRNIFVATTFSLVLYACGSGNPSENEIKSALAEIANRKGCATSVLFEEMPIKGEKRIRDNKKIIDAIVAANLVKKSGNTYELTDLGKSAYDANYKGFCHTEGYNIKNIAVVKKEDKRELSGTPLSGAWYVSFTIAPSNVSEWVKTPQILQEASNASLEKISAEEKYTVRFAKKAGENDIFVADPHFSFRGNSIHFNMSWSTF